MKSQLILSLALAFCLGFSACNSNNAEEDNPVSTPTDSTSKTGAPSVQYGPDDPSDSSSGVIQNNEGQQSQPFSNGTDTMPAK